MGYSTGDRIIEIGCIELKNKIITNNFFHSYINSKKIISESAYKIHGISNRDLENKPTFKDIADKLINFIGNSHLIIHNAKFDVGFINNELYSINKSLLKNNIIDTLTLARRKFPISPINLNAL